MKLGIGTVQFGMGYGISGVPVQTPAEEVERILAFGVERKISLLDTASSYGESEEVLGKSLPQGHPFKIVTKTPIYRKKEIDEADARHLESTFLRSLERLRQKKVYALLIHDGNDLLLPGGIHLIEAMRQLREKGLVQKIGVSVYDGEQIDRLLKIFTPDIIQLPINPFDQRLMQTAHLARLKSLKIEIHARSIFLQGLLLMNPGKELPPYFHRVRDQLEDYHQFLKNRSLTPLQASLRFVNNIGEIDFMICGVRTEKELQEIYSALDGEIRPEDFSKFSLKDESILNPSLWRLG
jgi:aryl-alcohol dehydrogenase-like predicted oxidoreductase